MKNTEILINLLKNASFIESELKDLIENVETEIKETEELIRLGKNTRKAFNELRTVTLEGFTDSMFVQLESEEQINAWGEGKLILK